MDNFKQNLKQLRQSKSLTQKDLAKQINVSEDCIYFWEKGRSEPSILDLINLANFFDVSIDYLVGRNFILKKLANASFFVHHFHI